MVRQMEDDDFLWAAELMERRRAVYERFWPVFWKPTEGVRERHADFLRSQVDTGRTVALRSEQGFLMAAIQGDRYDVDDFAVEPDEAWGSDGRRLLEALQGSGPLARPARVRVVTARQDLAKRRLLTDLGLTPVARWWVKALHPSQPAAVGAARVQLAGVTAVLVPAPPVYAPGGPVCILGDIPAEIAARAVPETEAAGAVLAVVTRDSSPAPAPEEELVLTAAGFDNVSEFFEGHLLHAGASPRGLS